ncbi:MAG: J domain-containing protein [Rubrivivax sp.]|nr:MAG: J domain-containing protein [Rubrivivax sp.]
MLDWERIGLEAPSEDLAEIKRAYARRVKVVRPDEDAVAYQALREAYDRLVQRAREAARRRETGSTLPTESASAGDGLDAPDPLLPVRIDTEQVARDVGVEVEVEVDERMGSAHRERPRPRDAWPLDERDAAPPSRGRTPQELALWVDAVCRSGGDALTEAEARLPLELAQLPFDARAEASIRLADVVLSYQALMPVTLLTALQRHFGWMEEYRSVRELGLERAEALRPLIIHLAEPVTDPEVLRDYAEVQQVKRLFDAGRDGLSFFTFVLMGEFWRRRAETLDAGILRRLGISEGQGMRMEGWADLAGLARVLLTLGVMLVACAAVKGDWPEGAKAGLLAGVYATLLWGLSLAILLALQQWRQADLKMDAFRRTGAIGGWIARSPLGRLGPDVVWPMLGVFLLFLAAELFLWHDGAPGRAWAALILSFIGFCMAAPRRLNPGVTALGLWLVGHFGARLPEAASALLMAWVLGGMQLYLKRGYRPHDGNAPGTPVGLPIGWPRGTLLERTLLFTIGLPTLVAWIAERAGDRLVLLALVLAGTPMLAGLDLPRGVPVALLVVSLATLLALQRWGLRSGRRMLGLG